jgi:hypothetical protein
MASEKSSSQAPIWTAVIYASLIVVGLLLEFLGFDRESDFFRLVGILAILGVVLFAPAVWALRSAGTARDARTDRLVAALERLAQEQALSDDARRVLNRRHERSILCRAIEEDISREDWDAATVLVKELAERFGYRQEAEEFRQRIEQARSRTTEVKVSDAVRNLDALIVRRQWDEASAEAARITRVYAESPRVEGLRHRVERARSQYKADLERRFLHAAKDERAEEAHELLKELDGYLTEAEAEPYQELARGVIGKARENLGVQFKLAAQDRDWARAASVGERIIRDFPNTRMAEEIRAVIDGIRERAAMQQRA